MTIIGNALKVLSLKAVIRAKTRAGATVTFKKGSTTMATKTADSSGYAELDVLSGDWGEWTVSASWSASGIGTAATGSTNVTVSAANTYNITITLQWYLIKNGNFMTGFSHKVVGPVRAAFRDDGNYITLTTDTQVQLSNDYAAGYFTTGIEMAFWQSLKVDSQEVGDDAFAGIVTKTTAREADFSSSVKLCSRRKSFTDRATKTLNISGVTGTKYIALQAKAWFYQDSGGPDGSHGEIRVYNLYLEG